MSRYRIVQYSDLHLKLSDPLGLPTADGLSTRVQKKLSLLRQVVDYAIEIKADEINDLGDLFDSINPASKLRNAYAREISRATAAGIRVVRITGNHETDGREADGLDAALLTDGLFQVVTEIEKHPTFTNLLYVPEISTDKILVALQKYPDDMIIGHFGVSGAVYPSGIEETSGVPQLYFGSRALPTFLGHIHKRQYLAEGNVVYIGALARANFGDMNIFTSCCVVDLEVDGSIISSVHHAFTEIDDIQLHELKYIEGESVDDEQVDTCEVEIFISPGDIVKLVYEGTHEWYSERRPMMLSKILLEMGAARVLLNFKPVSRRASIEADVQSSEGLNLEHWITEQAKSDNADVDLGLKYYREAVEKNGE